ncbi:copper homeostasis membrane protein CopD [Ramlibacter ginsenosidimutans]|uniref:Copper homeostasis membrane protein CopD n=1 Tax=Ramlibacter ginsenosidimutans TaxID=502333 RepID=A0A934WPM4_9BURK|nr:copper homeostasis membrane protein CopD [Ramlibacter ginsenosidimutans]MBK6008691.1 copper homeostasis membrane protein CopD [Ramlibacter ginsenosidimutans]
MQLMPAIRALHLLALAVLAGGFFFPLFVLPASAAAEPERSVLCTWLARLRLWGTAVALVTWVAWLLAVAASMSGEPLAQAWRPTVTGVVLEQTRFGHVWLIRCVLLVAMLFYLGQVRKRRVAGAASPGPAGALIAAGALLSQVWAGHAAAAPLSHAAADAVHLVAAALWVGCLLPLLALLVRARANATPWRALAARAANGFSGMGTAAVAALVVTGFLNGQMMVGSMLALATSAYGRLVLVKIVLFGAMLSLAAMNRWWLGPRLHSGGAQGDAARKLLRNVGIELALGAGVFAVVGLLGGTEPPAHEPGGMLHMEHAIGGTRRSAG